MLNENIDPRLGKMRYGMQIDIATLQSCIVLFLSREIREILLDQIGVFRNLCCVLMKFYKAAATSNVSKLTMTKLNDILRHDILLYFVL